MSDFTLEPGIAGFLFKQFARELQGKIVRQLYNAKVYVQPFPEEDKVVITIKHKVLPIEYTENLSEITSCIQDEAQNDGVIRDLARTVVSNYKDHIWHMFFYDYKKRQEKREQVVEEPEEQKIKVDMIDNTTRVAAATIELGVQKFYEEGYTNEQIAQMLNVDVTTVIGALQLQEALRNESANNNASEEA